MAKFFKEMYVYMYTLTYTHTQCAYNRERTRHEWEEKCRDSSFIFNQKTHTDPTPLSSLSILLVPFRAVEHSNH